jgi:hypothetical protein
MPHMASFGRGDGRISGSCRPPGCFAKIWVLAIANCSLQGTDLRSQYYSSSSKCSVVLQATIRGVEMASSKEDAMRAAGTDKIRAQSGPPLPNFRQEAFAQRIAAGCSATAAYASAYGRPRDASSRVNGRRLLTNANIRARIAQIERDATLSSLSTIREVLDAAGCTTVDRIRNGSFKQACRAVDCFADTVLKLNRALSPQSGSDERGSRIGMNG